MRTDTTLPVRLRATGWLETLSPLHVGGAERDTNGAMAVAVDGRGRLYVPGTSLAGALRGLLHADPDAGDGPRHHPANRRWGWAEEKGQGGAVSRVVVHDALVAAGRDLDEHGLPGRPLAASRLESRMSTGIDRRHGSAAHGFLFTRAVVPRGTWLRFGLDLNSSVEEIEEDREYLSRLLSLLADGHLRLGAAVTRGLGRTRLHAGSTAVWEERFDSRQGLFAALRDQGDRWPITRWRRGTAASHTVEVEVTWRPAAPVMVRSGTDGLTVDTLPMVTAATGDMVSLVLPGSSLKGALRARAELIERTARGVDAPTGGRDDGDAEHSAVFRAQLDQLPAVRALFGSAARSQEDTVSGRGALTVDECRAKNLIPAELWPQAYGPPSGRTPAPEGANGTPALEQLCAHGLERADHVAIDRWTGGAAEGRLYSVLEPHGVTWEPITMSLDLRRLAVAAPDAADDAALALLLLVLRDLRTGRLPLGGNVNRGMGDILVEHVGLTLPHHGRTDLDTFLHSEEAARLSRAWRAYLDGGSL